MRLAQKHRLKYQAKIPNYVDTLANILILLMKIIQNYKIGRV